MWWISKNFFEFLGNIVEFLIIGQKLSSTWLNGFTAFLGESLKMENKNCRFGFIKLMDHNDRS